MKEVCRCVGWLHPTDLLKGRAFPVKNDIRPDVNNPADLSCNGLWLNNCVQMEPSGSLSSPKSEPLAAVVDVSSELIKRGGTQNERVICRPSSNDERLFQLKSPSETSAPFGAHILPVSGNYLLSNERRTSQRARRDAQFISRAPRPCIFSPDNVRGPAGENTSSVVSPTWQNN